MLGLIPKNKYSSKGSVWPEYMINYITMVLTAFEIYKNRKQNVELQQNSKNRCKLCALLKMFSSTPQSRT